REARAVLSDWQARRVRYHDAFVMAKSTEQLDVLVLGDHPATYLAAALLCSKSKLRVMHATIPGPSRADRLVIVNPRLFELDPCRAATGKKLNLSPIDGLQFLSDDVPTRSEHRAKTPIVHVASLASVRDAMMNLCDAAEIECASSKSLQILRLD